jgi:hypothetical protein
MRCPSLLIAFAVVFQNTNAATYHVDDTRGDDSASGLSPAAAWRSLERVNANPSQTGDRILLRSGGHDFFCAPVSRTLSPAIGSAKPAP